MPAAINSETTILGLFDVNRRIKILWVPCLLAVVHRMCTNRVIRPFFCLFDCGRNPCRLGRLGRLGRGAGCQCQHHQRCRPHTEVYDSHSGPLIWTRRYPTDVSIIPCCQRREGLTQRPAPATPLPGATRHAPSGLPGGIGPLPATHVAASGQKPPSAILESMAGMLALVHTMAA